MVELFDNYLSQIQKKLRQQSVAEGFIDEFLENMGDQLYSMLDELMNQEPELDRSEAIVSVLSSCEPVDVVVGQVTDQYHSKGGVPRLDSDDFQEHLKFLAPVESRLVSLSRRINYGLDSMNHKYQKWHNWYSIQSSPSLTAFVYLAVWFGSLGILLLISSMTPPLNLVTVYPDNLTFLHFGDVSNVFVSYPLATSIEVSSVRILLQSVLVMLFTVYLIGRIGWKYPVKYSIVVMGIFSLFLTLILVIMNQSVRLSPVLYQVSFGDEWTFFTSDWYYGEAITYPAYTTYFIVSVYMRLLPYVLFPSLGFVLLSNTIKSLKDRVVQKPFVFSGIRIIAKLAVAILFISTIFIIPTGYIEISESTDIPIPDSDVPLIYKFDLNWAETYQSINGSQEHLTILPQFGQLEFSLFALYHLVNPQQMSDIYATGNLSLLHDQEESNSSLHLFDTLGLLYLPDIEENGGWQSLIGNQINSSYPFNDFTPSIDTNDNLLSWYLNGDEVNISVNTIIYSANTNDSEYVFHFDSVHGWLMTAELRLDTESWTQGLDLRTLTISRTFTAQPLQQSDFENIYILDNLLVLPLLGVLALIILVDGIRLMKKKFSMQGGIVNLQPLEK